MGERARPAPRRGAVGVVVAVALATVLSMVPRTSAGASPEAVTDAAGLHAAIVDGNATGAAYELTLAGTITLTASLPPLTEDVVVRGDAAATSVLDGAGHRIFQLQGAHRLVVEDLTLRGAEAVGDGGAIHGQDVGSSIRVVRSRLVANHATGGGATAAPSGATPSRWSTAPSPTTRPAPTAVRS